MTRKKFIPYIIGGAILLILVIWIITSYNSLVGKQEKMQNQWNEIQNTYQRRLDLIPNLVSIVKGVSDFEQTTLVQITEARSKAMNSLSNDELTPENYQNQKKLQDAVSANVSRLLIRVESYPELKGTEAYRGLQTQLEGTERRIAIARKDFNAAVADYNRKVRSFPTSIISGIFGFKKKTGFQADAGTENAGEVKFK